MNKQPTALRLADELLALHGPTAIDEDVSNELRRLHAVNTALLDALKAIVKSLSDHDDEGMIEHAQQMIDARAAIAKAEAA